MEKFMLFKLFQKLKIAKMFRNELIILFTFIDFVRISLTHLLLSTSIILRILKLRKHITELPITQNQS